MHAYVVLRERERESTVGANEIQERANDALAVALRACGAMGVDRAREGKQGKGERNEALHHALLWYYLISYQTSIEAEENGWNGSEWHFYTVSVKMRGAQNYLKEICHFVNQILCQARIIENRGKRQEAFSHFAKTVQNGLQCLDSLRPR